MRLQSPRPKAKVTLELENLTERILLSASTFPSLDNSSFTHDSALISGSSDVQGNHPQIVPASGPAQSGSGTSGGSSSAPAIEGGGSGHTGSPKSGSSTITPETSAGPDGVGGQQAVWEPGPDSDYLWSDPENWSTDAVPDGADAVFTGQYNYECIVDESTSETKIILTNGPGGTPFNAPLEIQGGVALNVPAYVDDNPGSNVYNVAYLAANSVQNYDGGVNYEFFDYNVGTGGKINIYNGATVIVDGYANTSQKCGSPINVTNGQLIFGDKGNNNDYCTFQLTSASADINIQKNCSLTIYQTGNTIIDNSANPGAVITNNGTVFLQGVSGAQSTTISVPLQNYGTLNVNGGKWYFDQKDVSGNDLSMSAGSINMNDNASIDCFDNYTQTAGVFNIMDNNETLTADLGSANFNGGTLEFTSPTGYGTLNTFNLVFNGVTLDMGIEGEAPYAHDQISCTDCTIAKGNNTLNVTMSNGTPTEYGTIWNLINVSTGDAITGDFTHANLPPDVDEVVPVTNNWQCEWVGT